MYIQAAQFFDNMALLRIGSWFNLTLTSHSNYQFFDNMALLRISSWFNLTLISHSK